MSHCLYKTVVSEYPHSESAFGRASGVNSSIPIAAMQSGQYVLVTAA